MLVVYGIGNCDTCRKARKWLDGQSVAYRFHDFRKDGLEPSTVAAWLTEIGADRLVNRRGTTWRKLGDADKQAIEGADAAGAIAGEPTLIKRPVFDLGDRRLIGFDKDVQSALAAIGG